MLRLGARYMFEDSVKLMYEKQGLGYIESDDFWDEHEMSLKQFKVDMKYLYGLLQSATRSHANPYLLQHKHNKDGLQV